MVGFGAFLKVASIGLDVDRDKQTQQRLLPCLCPEHLDWGSAHLNSEDGGGQFKCVRGGRETQSSTLASLTSRLLLAIHWEMPSRLES